MKKRIWLLVSLTIIIATTISMGENPVLTSIQGNGRVTWTNTVISNAVYSLEWASQAGGPWHTFTYQPINSIDAHDQTSFEVEVPMFYRVVMTTNETPQGMVWIDGGDAVLGQYGIVTPIHTNYISGFWMDGMEVKKTLWDKVYNWAITNEYAFDNAGQAKGTNHPVQSINWYDCVKWCNARSEQEGLNPIYHEDFFLSTVYRTGQTDIQNTWVAWLENGYRLPTEAEWEKAARGGHLDQLFPWGQDTIAHTRSNYEANTNLYDYDRSLTSSYHPTYNNGVLPYTSPVGSFQANGYGLYDMSGNIQEWCWDWQDTYSPSYQVDPRGPTYGTWRVMRGGSWTHNAPRTRCADRTAPTSPDSISSDFGFRCARDH